MDGWMNKKMNERLYTFPLIFCHIWYKKICNYHGLHIELLKKIKAKNKRDKYE